MFDQKTPSMNRTSTNFWSLNSGRLQSAALLCHQIVALKKYLCSFVLPASGIPYFRQFFRHVPNFKLSWPKYSNEFLLFRFDVDTHHRVSVKIGDKMDLICPRVGDGMDHNNHMYHRIYQVDEESFRWVICYFCFFHLQPRDHKIKMTN